MVIAKVTVNASSAKTVFCEPLPIGASGLQVQFAFDDPAWKQLSKTAVFRNRSKSFNALLVDDCAVIPHELLTDVTDVLYAGIYGTDSKKALIIPTVWAKLGEISGSANPAADCSTDPTLPYWAQVKESVETLRSSALDQEDLENALNEAKASGAFNGPQGKQGEKGDKGDQGPAGADGKDGYSPVAGVDYWTEADRNDIIAQVSDILRQRYDIRVNAAGSVISLTDACDGPLQGLRIFGRTSQSGVPSPDTPAVPESIGNVSVKICGKNICAGIKPGAYLAASGVYAAEVASYNCTELIPVVSDLRYTSDNNLGANISDIHFFDRSGSWIGRFSKDHLNTRPDNAGFMAFNYYKTDGLSWVQVEISSAATEYEPYAVQTLSVVMSNGLSGIPVSGGGNYTDEDGQMWLCDEADFGSGKFVQRIGKIASYNGEAVTGDYLSSTGALSTGATVLYALPAPIETDLASEAMTAFAALRTQYPGTTIYADGVYMSVAYVADTKRYIDNKFNHLAAAMVNQV